MEHYLSEVDWLRWEQLEDPYTEMDNALYKNAIETARKMKAKGYSIEEIAEITGLNSKEINAI